MDENSRFTSSRVNRLNRKMATPSPMTSAKVPSQPGCHARSTESMKEKLLGFAGRHYNWNTEMMKSVLHFNESLAEFSFRK